MKKVTIILLLILNSLFIIPHSIVHAEYVLPYPSYMPGNKMYRVSRLIDVLKQPWYFGSFASFRYRLELSDKYLVEAKTLFEYKQYILAVDALKRSDQQFSELPTFYFRARAEHKDVTPLITTLTDATTKHIEVFERLRGELPYEFNWQPEKKEATLLPIHALLMKSIDIRQQVAVQIH